MDRPNRWFEGDCSNYARALQDAAAEDGRELRLGRWVSSQGTEHIFAHNGTHAFDALGQHPLPYRREGSQDEYDVDPETIESEWDHPVDENVIEEAYPEASENWQNRTASRPAWMPKLSYEWVRNSDGNVRWGPEGAAGMLFHHPETDTYLLGHRSPEVDQGGTWGIPGGAIDPGEEPYQAALREAQEEFGPNVPQHKVTGIYKASPVPDWSYHTVMADVPQQFEPEYADSWETQGHGWFTPEEMQGLNLHPGFASAWNAGHLTKQSRAEYSISSGGDAVGPEYHGYHTMFHNIGDEQKPVGKLDYTYHNGENGIRMVEVDPAYRRQGIADKLLAHLKNEGGWDRPDEPVYAQGDFNTPEGQAWLDKHGIKQWNGEDPYTFSRTAKNGFFYHTAPREYREQIEREGLVPTDEAPVSPWAKMKPSQQRDEQPHGVYLWNDPENAKGYAYNLEGRKAVDGELPGDKREQGELGPDWEEYMNAYPGERNEYNEPANEDDYWDYEGKYKPKPLYDIWKVNTLGYDPQIDPENAIHHGEMYAEEAQQRMNEEANQDWGGKERAYDPWQIEKSEGHRWYLPHRIEPQRLTLHDSITPEEMTMNNMEDAYSNGKQIPNAWSQVPLSEWNEKAQQRYVGDPNIMREIAPQDR